MSTAIETKLAEINSVRNPPIGLPEGNENICPDGVGHYQHYQTGESIYWHPDTGAHLIYGLIKGKWSNLGWERSTLGYPTTDETDTGSGPGRYNNFQNGIIIWRSGSNEAFAVYGSIYHKWTLDGSDSGHLGFPISDQHLVQDPLGFLKHQNFENGEIIDHVILAGHFIKSTLRNEVYKLENNKRRWVPDEATLLSMTTWKRVIVLSDSEIFTIPQGDNIPSVTFDISTIHICSDPIVTGPSHPPRFAPELPTTTEIKSDGSISTVNTSPLASVTDKLWDVGYTLRIKMLGGTTAFVKSKVRQFAEIWTQYANIHFQFVDPTEPADIRISFEAHKGSWSVVGRDAQWIPFDIATMNFGWFSDTTPDSEFSRVVVHEFGHALGLIHEHQSPAGQIQWDREKAYQYYMQINEGWDRAMVDEQVFQKYSVGQTNFSQFDPNSIMEYWVPAEITLNHMAIPGNTTLSPTDIEYIRDWYPFPPTPHNATGMLHTGDDCDEIDFLVEYNVVDNDVIEFNLSGTPKIVFWWKAIEIPTGSSTYQMLAVERTLLQADDMGLFTTMQIRVGNIDKSRPIRFWKAKFLGIHTLLHFFWDVLPVIAGGCRISLTWKRDHC